MSVFSKSVSVDRDDPRYPERMRELPDMPATLRFRGKLPREDLPTAGIVGARLCSPYGHRIAYSFAEELSKRGVQIISGMALGIDGYAAEGALSAGAQAFAVLGCGTDICYPAGNRPLYERMLENGGILSEYPDGAEPKSWHFPRRNRIISALSDVLIVVEAKERSGSLITADCALLQGKCVYAVPGRVGDRLSDGCNRLIAQGAGIAWSAEAILEELSEMALVRGRKGPQPLSLSSAGNTKLRKKASLLSREALCIMSLLGAEDAKGVEELAVSAHFSVPQVLGALNELVRNDFAKEELRGQYVLIPSQLL